LISPQTLKDYLAQHIGSRSIGGSVYCAYDVLGTDVEGAGRTEQLYLWVVCEEYLRVGQTLQLGSASSLPLVISIQKTGNHPPVIRHQIPRDGGYFSQDIETLFPPQIRSKILSGDVRMSNQRVERLQQEIQTDIIP
jgi:hypothetical protein